MSDSISPKQPPGRVERFTVTNQHRRIDYLVGEVRLPLIARFAVPDDSTWTAPVV